jgi:hypothetical protein
MVSDALSPDDMIGMPRESGLLGRIWRQDSDVTDDKAPLGVALLVIFGGSAILWFGIFLVVQSLS